MYRLIYVQDNISLFTIGAQSKVLQPLEERMEVPLKELKSLIKEVQMNQPYFYIWCV